MRQSGFLVMVLVFSFASSVWAQQVDPCSGIACSGHGRCIVVRGEPACACEAEFTADASGLNCVSIAPVVTPVVTPVVQPVVAAPEPQPAPVVEVSAPQPAPVVTPAPVPRVRVGRLRLNTPFLTERERPYRDLRIVGMAYAYAALPLLIVGIVSEFTEFTTYDAELALDGVGAVLVVTGAILILVGFFRQRHIRREVMASQVAYVPVLGTD